MTRLDRTMLWVAAAACGGLAALCIIGAHLGTAGAGRVFGSAPMAAAGVVLAVGLLAASVRVLLGGAIRNAGLAAAYGGAGLVLAGAMLGSPAAHRLAAEHFGSRKVAGGMMHVATGLPTDRLCDEQTGEPIATLPFTLSLERFEVVPHDFPSAAASRPARAIKDVVAHLAVTRDGQVLAHAAVSANRPLHYGGYQFTLTRCVPGEQPAVELTVASQWGLVVICGGVSLFVVSVLHHMWVHPAAGYLRRRGARGHQD